MPNTAARPDDIKPVPTTDQVIAPAPQLNEFEWKRMIEVLANGNTRTVHFTGVTIF